MTKMIFSLGEAHLTRIVELRKENATKHKGKRPSQMGWLFVASPLNNFFEVKPYGSPKEARLSLNAWMEQLLTFIENNFEKNSGQGP